MNTIPLHYETKSMTIEGVYLTFKSLDLLADKLVDMYCSVQMSIPNTILRVEFELPLLDSRGKIMLMQFMKALDTINAKPNTGNVEIDWRYQYEDKDMEELGELIEELTSLNVHMIQTEAYSVIRKV
jgi:hypothetical protein